MKISLKHFLLADLFIILLSSINVKNDDYDDYDDYDEELKDTVIIDGIKYARIVDDGYFDDLEYDEGMWTLPQFA